MKEERIDKIKKKDADDAEMQWSLKRIAIFLTVAGVALFLLYYLFVNRIGKVLGDRDMSSQSDKPQISLPSKEDIDDILENVQENISGIDAGNIISSQAQVENAIKELQKLTKEENFKKNVCSAICPK